MTYDGRKEIEVTYKEAFKMAINFLTDLSDNELEDFIDKLNLRVGVKYKIKEE
jgi:hypothetical protein